MGSDDAGRDGHDATVLERDPAEPPDPETAWPDWERPVGEAAIAKVLHATSGVTVRRGSPSPAS